MNKKNATLYYDDTCGFCTASILFLKKRHAKLRYVGLSQAKLPKRFDRIDSLILKDHRGYHIYSNAAIRAITTIGGIYKIVKIGHIIPRKLRDHIYKKIAKKRHCLIKQEK